MVAGDHPVRVIDAFVDAMDLARLGFSKVVAEATGRPPYRPGDLLKLYVYGDMSQLRSSRRLERETGRNSGAVADRPRVAFVQDDRRFSQRHARAIVGVCRAFMRFCRGQALYGGEVLAIDGTKIGRWPAARR